MSAKQTDYDTGSEQNLHNVLLGAPKGLSGLATLTGVGPELLVRFSIRGPAELVKGLLPQTA